MKMAFFDRDGTILRSHPIEDWPRVTEPEFFPDSIYCLQELSARGFLLSLLMYEYIIGEGVITEAQHDAYMQKMLNVLGAKGIMLDAIELCPHARNSQCRCAKPKTAMIEDVLDRYPDADISQSFLVGNSILDVQMAHTVGLRAFSIGFKALNATQIGSLSEVLLYV
jgi:D-glycero-D-manno-heptose 1,7-bisphosphate phosphatase